MENLKILYEDKNMIFLVKPPGYSCEDEKNPKNEKNLVKLIKEYRLQKNEIGEAFAVHRLDVVTSGVMVYAKNKKFAGRLGAIVGNHREFCKEYLAVTEGTPEEKSGEYRDFLFKDSSKNKSYVVKKMRKGVKEAILNYELIGSKSYEGKAYSLFKISLLTGRTHQIRVQLSSRKMPVLGDGKYGSFNSNCELALFSHGLKFKNPVDGKELCFKALPDFSKYPWSIFGEEKDRI